MRLRLCFHSGAFAGTRQGVPQAGDRQLQAAPAWRWEQNAGLAKELWAFVAVNFIYAHDEKDTLAAARTIFDAMADLGNEEEILTERVKAAALLLEFYCEAGNEDEVKKLHQLLQALDAGEEGERIKESVERILANGCPPPGKN